MKKTFKKRAFISAIAMLIVSAIVLTSATYAWFSMAKRVEVESMELNVTSPEGIQISANTSAFTTKLTVDDIKGTSTTRFNAYTGNVNNIPTTVIPSSSIFETNGALPQWFTGSIDDQNRMNISSRTEVGSGFVAFDLFVKVKDATTVKFGSSTVTCDGNPELPTAMRIALVRCGTVEEGADASTIQSVLPSSAAAGKVIYELDAANHTSAAIAQGASGVMTTLGLYTTGSFSVVGKPYNNIVNGTGATSYARAIGATIATTASNANISVAAGITRLRVYMWMEGNDVDCANDVAGSTINFNLVLEID